MSDRQADLRRRRNGRLIIGLALVALVVGAALFGGGDEGPQKPSSDRAPEEAVACDAEAPEAADPQQYEEAPAPLDPASASDLHAVITTSCGEIEIDLLEQEAPASVANFVFLAGEGFYDGLLWHRVERNSVLQTGDPNGQNGEEPDGPGYVIPDEFPERDNEYIYGVVGFANAGPGTTGSQFFIVVHDPEKSCDAKGRPQGQQGTHHCPAGFQPLYNIFGTVSEASYETLERIAAQETQGGNNPVEAVKPVENIYIESIQILE